MLHSKSKGGGLFSLFVLLGVAVHYVAAQSGGIEWIGKGGNTDWHNPANWNGNVVPSVDDNVTISAATVEIFSKYLRTQVYSLTLSNKASLYVYSVLQVGEGDGGSGGTVVGDSSSSINFIVGNGRFNVSGFGDVTIGNLTLIAGSNTEIQNGGALYVNSLQASYLHLQNYLLQTSTKSNNVGQIDLIASTLRGGDSTTLLTANTVNVFSTVAVAAKHMVGVTTVTTQKSKETHSTAIATMKNAVSVVDTLTFNAKSLHLFGDVSLQLQEGASVYT